MHRCCATFASMRAANRFQVPLTALGQKLARQGASSPAWPAGKHWRSTINACSFFDPRDALRTRIAFTHLRESHLSDLDPAHICSSLTTCRFSVLRSLYGVPALLML